MIIMVHGTYHPSLTWGNFIIDKTHVQYSYFKFYNLFPVDYIRNNNKCKPVAFNKYKNQSATM